MDSTNRCGARTSTIAVAVIALSLSTMGCVQRLPHYTYKVPTPAAGRYVTFFVLPGHSSGDTSTDLRLKTAVVTALAEQGLIETSPEEAEAVVVIHMTTPGSRSREAFYQGWGGWAWRAAGARPRNGADTYAVGSVVVDVFDAWTKTLVWNGSAPDGKHVERMFKDFPAIDHGALARSTSAGPSPPDGPMRIIFSSRPAILIRLDGEPKYEDIAGTTLQRITNADAFMLRDESGMHYARIGGRWLEASDISGSWSLAGMVPDGADIALQEYTTQPHLDRFAATGSHGPTPMIYVEVAPAELVITDGEPQYADVGGTSLRRMRNANASVFQEPTDRQLYVHLPVGWFRAWTTNGPWQAVGDADLPTDLTALRAQSGPA